MAKKAKQPGRKNPIAKALRSPHLRPKRFLTKKDREKERGPRKEDFDG